MLCPKPLGELIVAVVIAIIMEKRERERETNHELVLWFPCPRPVF